MVVLVIIRAQHSILCQYVIFFMIGSCLSASGTDLILVHSSGPICMGQWARDVHPVPQQEWLEIGGVQEDEC